MSLEALTVEEGGEGFYTVSLDAEPAGPVTVTPSPPSGTDVSVDPSALTFTTENWGMPQTVAVRAEEDTDALADPVVTIGNLVAGSDYGSVSARSVEVSIVENDTPTLSVAAVEGLESVGALVFEVSLSVPSSSEVSVDYSTSDGSGSAVLGRVRTMRRRSGR